jgi:hypothetical protein
MSQSFLLLQLQEGWAQIHGMFSQEGFKPEDLWPWEARTTFYSIYVPKEDEEDCPPKTFPGILTVKGGVVNEALIDLELKYYN